MNDPEFKEAVRTVWDISSTTYDRIPGHRIGAPEELNAWNRELSRYLPSAPRKVLDIGCGTGAMGLILARLGYQVTGIDLSGQMIAKAHKNAEESGTVIELRAGDAEQLPFDDGSFDVIVTRHLLWTLPKPEIALREWYRVLVPGGRVLIVDGIWNDGSPGTRVRVCISSWMARIFDPETTHPASYGSNVRARLPYGGGVPLKAMLDYTGQAGFNDIQYRDLMYIRKLQKPELSWYRRFAQGKSYYLIAATKPGSYIP